MKLKGRLQGFERGTQDTNQSRIKKDLFEFINDTPEPTSIFYKYAVSQSLEAFDLKKKVKMIHLKEVFDQDLEVWPCSPGLPWRDHGYLTNADVRDDPDAVNKIRKFWHLVKHGETIQPPDCCAYYDLEPVRKRPKVVWEYPATITFGEACFALPLIRAYTAGKHPIVYGFESANCIFSKFDKTLPKWLMEKAFCVLVYNIDFAHYENYGVPNARNNFRMFEYIKDYWINTTIRLANGERWEKNCGIPTGSYFNQLVGSICNYILLKWFHYETGIIIPKLQLGSGDDSIMATTSQDDNIKEKCAELAESIGMDVK